MDNNLVVEDGAIPPPRLPYRLPPLVPTVKYLMYKVKKLIK